MLYQNTYRLKKLEESDFPAVQELLWKVFQKKSSVLALKHKYDASHLALEYVSTIAYKDEIPVAFYGAILQKFRKHEQEIIVAQACDSSTLKAHQGKGLHFELAKLSYEIMQNQNVSCVYAFLNENSFHSTKKLGWHSYFNMQRFHVKVNTFPLAKALNKFSLNGFYDYFFNKKSTEKLLVALTNQHEEKYTQVIDQEFITHKNKLKNHYTVKLEDCIFWIKIERILQVGLCYADSEVSLQKAIEKLKRKAFYLGIPEILFQVDPKSKLSKQLTTIVLPKESWHVGYLPFDSKIDLKDFIFTYAAVDTF